jgi:hypothetical protein
MEFSIVGLILAGLMVCLGFIALLKQKTYLDTQSGKTAVDVPFVGKMTTNAPALVFVFLGFALALYAGKKSPTPLDSPVTWTLKGTFATPQHTNFTWSAGWLELVPTKTHVKMSNKGAFEVTTELKAGESITNSVDALVYTHDLGSSQINLQQEVRNYLAGSNSLIESLDAHTCTLIFRPLALTFYGQDDHPL